MSIQKSTIPVPETAPAPSSGHALPILPTFRTSTGEDASPQCRGVRARSPQCSGPYRSSPALSTVISFAKKIPKFGETRFLLLKPVATLTSERDGANKRFLELNENLTDIQTQLDDKQEENYNLKKQNQELKAALEKANKKL
ncbi:hypothetical protein BDD12DRAFT_979141 [Trichophaea hybrida]|nr:hypothetical protein BDD12DRAFT_979141 [Trichophaea hybrida]